ncbi:DUF1800 domain-containing protein [Methylobacterium platani]|uniref:Uncharacterized protein n=1 Tax=Methylobacterium platani JCM 14648 TaxID=1295136 RepID=A0ABR5H4V9_9HYPH|nr:DUF1800 family protein [Methylobacterium platani]KMO18914.1 hypothetical protein SQ03_09290 [Methylobacterium platani JCM 14648]
MTVDPRRTALGLGRFGLGARPGDLARDEPVEEILRREVLAAVVPMPGGPDLAAAPTLLSALRAEEQARKLARAGSPDGPMPAGPPAPPIPERTYRAEVAARLALAQAAPVGFVERLVWFWANHFTVSVARGPQLRVSAGAFEREAIRPHVLGRFRDLLLAAATHPAMLIYLDNVASVGPNSPAGQRRGAGPGKGLNENLGRELLELHTLGADGGYGQDDVTALARILTGWSLQRDGNAEGLPGATAFRRGAHEPGAVTLMGRTYLDIGPEQLPMALADLAAHPATARHVAFRLARHFVADDPPPALVARLARTFTDQDGDLSRLALTLLESPEAWDPVQRKVRSPQEFVVAAMRGLALAPDPRLAMAGLASLGQPFWSAPAPNGYPDEAGTWASPEGLRTRLDVAARTGQLAAGTDPTAFADAVLGPLATDETRTALRRAESRAQGIALVLMAPEFQRR